MRDNPTSCLQCGAALITSLIFLTVLTILGMSTLGTAMLESKMSGNLRDRNNAFQAAEFGLRDAELYIANAGRIVGLTDDAYDTGATTCTPTSGNCDAQTCKYGLCYNSGNMSADGNAWYGASNSVWNKEDMWKNAIQYATDDQYAGKVPNSRKTVGRANPTQLTFNINCSQILGTCQYSQPLLLPLVQRQPEYLIEAFEKNVAGSRFYYRITARGYGVRSGTRVMLQEVYTP
jgi:Tfp pilus assembly protein PilX